MTIYSHPSKIVAFAVMNNLIKYIYYISINVLSLDTVDFKECDPMFRITTLWFSESISPLSETYDVVHSTHTFFLRGLHFPWQK